jgi:hypothetical protein
LTCPSNVMAFFGGAAGFGSSISNSTPGSVTLESRTVQCLAAREFLPQAIRDDQALHANLDAPRPRGGDRASRSRRKRQPARRGQRSRNGLHAAYLLLRKDATRPSSRPGAVGVLVDVRLFVSFVRIVKAHNGLVAIGQRVQRPIRHGGRDSM